MSEIVSAILRYVPVVVGFVVILGPIAYFQWRAASRRYRKIDAHRSAGTIGPATFVRGQQLPVHYDALARIGTKGEAPRTLDDHILKASLGVRLVVFGLSLAVIGFTFVPGIASTGWHDAIREMPAPPIVIQLLILAVAANGLFYIFGFEARYNRDLLVTTRMFFSRREYRWKDLEWIGDDGAYEFVLQFANGKAKVLKHCRGMEEFKAFAQEQIRENR